MTPTNNVNEYVVGAVKLAPTGAVTGFTLTGVSLQDWVYIVTILYTLLMSAHLIYKWIKERNPGS